MASTAPQVRKRILVVEDEENVRKTLTQLLGDEGYDVLAAEDGSAAMSEAQGSHPDLILLDLGLPTDPFGGGHFDGFGVMQWLHRRIQDREIPIIVLTARQDKETRRLAYELGAAVFLTKPFRCEDLFSAVRIVLGQA